MCVCSKQRGVGLVSKRGDMSEGAGRMGTTETRRRKNGGARYEKGLMGDWMSVDGGRKV